MRQDGEYVLSLVWIIGNEPEKHTIIPSCKNWNVSYAAAEQNE